MSLKRSFTTGDLRVTVHLEQQILTCDTPGCDDEDEPAFAPTLNPALLADFVPAGVLLHKAKQFDDGLLASVELLIQRGAGKLPGKRWLLARWAEATARAREGGDAIEVLVAACRLAGVEAPVARRLEPAVVDRLQDFHAEPRRSMPLGLYTGSPELQRTFQQDRMLQTRLTDVAAIRRAAAALAAEPRLGAAYEAHLELAAALTARPTVADLRAISSRAIPRELALFPPADSPEAELVRDLGDELLDGDLLDELIRRVRAGRLDLAPGPRPGWYRETLASLTPLLTPGGAPEAARRRTTAEYDLYLEDLFRTAYALARETHVKDLEEEEEEEEGGDDEDAPVTVKITPKVTLDPLPTLYLRRANVYRALRKRLEGVLGPALADTARTMPSGQAGQAIGHELREMEKLFRGAAAASWRELGVLPERTVPGWTGDSAALARRFARWRRGIARDPDVAADARMMIPVSYDPDTEIVRVWAFLGWTRREAYFAFHRRPTVTAERAGGDPSRGAPRIAPDFWPRTCSIEQPVMVEVPVRQRLDRDAFRRVCDAHRTPDAIVAALR